MPHRTSEYAGNRVLKTLGAAIRAARKARDLSQESLAVDAGVDRSYLGALERGEVNVTVMVISRVCDALRIKPSELLRRAGV
jgi:transcriptional regulator with XRE-family HTH domain